MFGAEFKKSKKNVKAKTARRFLARNKWKIAKAKIGEWKAFLKHVAFMKECL